MQCPNPVSFDTFLISDDGKFLLDDTGQFYLIVDAPIVPSSDTLVYIFQFASLAQAQADPIIGPFLNLFQTLELLVFADLTMNSVTPIPGYWLMLTMTGGINATLFTHPNIQILIDQNRIPSNQQAVVATKIPTGNIIIVYDNSSTFIPAGIC